MQALFICLAAFYPFAQRDTVKLRHVPIHENDIRPVFRFRHLNQSLESFFPVDGLLYRHSPKSATGSAIMLLTALLSSTRSMFRFMPILPNTGVSSSDHAETLRHKGFQDIYIQTCSRTVLRRNIEQAGEADAITSWVYYKSIQRSKRQFSAELKVSAAKSGCPWEDFPRCQFDGACASLLEFNEQSGVPPMISPAISPKEG